MLTREMVEKSLPINLKSAATQNLTDMVNNIVSDPLIAEQVRNNFISYTSVLQDGKFKTEDYLHAVAYVSYKLMGHSNQDAYFKTFPTRHQALVARGTSSKDIAAYVSAYARGKLVNLIMEQSLVPTWVLNQDLYQKALNTQAELMATANSEKVRSDAANSILTHLGKPKDANFQMSVDMRESSGMNEMKDAMLAMANMQRKAIEAGVTIGAVTRQTIIPKEVIEHAP